MFGKSENAESKMKKIEGEAISSIIDSSMLLTGEITFKGKARIDGTVKGNIQGDHLILSKSGKIEGDITVQSFNCFGTLTGNIKADILVARKDCSLQGKLEAGSLTVEPGARIKGEIKAASENQPAAPAKPEKKA